MIMLCFTAPQAIVLNQLLTIIFCENCSNCTLIRFQLNSFGEMYFLKVNYKKDLRGKNK